MSDNEITHCIIINNISVVIIIIINDGIYASRGGIMSKQTSRSEGIGKPNDRVKKIDSNYFFPA